MLGDIAAMHVLWVKSTTQRIALEGGSWWKMHQNQLSGSANENHVHIIMLGILVKGHTAAMHVLMVTCTTLIVALDVGSWWTPS